MPAHLASTPMTRQPRTPIKSITDLIARLEEVRADLDSRNLTTLRQYEHVGWALRPIETLLDRCREEAESIRWTDQHTQSFARVPPKGRS